MGKKAISDASYERKNASFHTIWMDLDTSAPYVKRYNAEFGMKRRNQTSFITRTDLSLMPEPSLIDGTANQSFYSSSDSAAKAPDGKAKLDTVIKGPNSAVEQSDLQA